MPDSLVFAPGTPARVEPLEGPETPPIDATVELHDARGVQLRLPAGISLEAGLPVHVEVSDDAGLYTFSTIVQEMSLRDARLLNLEAPDEIELTQRRAYTRVPDALAISVITREGGRITSISSQTIDVSIGGASLLAAQPLAGPVTVVLSLPSPDRPLPMRLRLDGEVRRCAEQSPGQFRVALAFAELSGDEEYLLSQYLFKRMREIRRAKVHR